MTETIYSFQEINKTKLKVTIKINTAVCDWFNIICLVWSAIVEQWKQKLFQGVNTLVIIDLIPPTCHMLSFSLLCCLPADAGHALCLCGAVQEESWPGVWAAGYDQQLCMKDAVKHLKKIQQSVTGHPQ